MQYNTVMKNNLYSLKDLREISDAKIYLTLDRFVYYFTLRFI